MFRLGSCIVSIHNCIFQASSYLKLVGEVDDYYEDILDSAFAASSNGILNVEDVEARHDGDNLNKIQMLLFYIFQLHVDHDKALVIYHKFTIIIFWNVSGLIIVFID